MKLSVQRTGALQAIRAWALRHPVLFILLGALVVRVLAAAFITVFIGLDGKVFSDVKVYDTLAIRRKSAFRARSSS